MTSGMANWTIIRIEGTNTYLPRATVAGCTHTGHRPHSEHVAVSIAEEMVRQLGERPSPRPRGTISGLAGVTHTWPVSPRA